MYQPMIIDNNNFNQKIKINLEGSSQVKGLGANSLQQSYRMGSKDKLRNPQMQTMNTSQTVVSSTNNLKTYDEVAISG